MPLAVPRDPPVASLRRRAAAGAIDAGVWIAALGACIAAAVAASELFERLGRPPRWLDGDAGSSARVRWWWNVPLTGALTGIGVATRNCRSPRMRLLGLRRVDARTRGPVSVHGAVVATTAETFTSRVARTINRPTLERDAARRAAASEEVDRLLRSRREDEPDEFAEAAMDVYRRHGVGCGPLMWRIPVQAVAVRLPAIRSRQRQTLGERLAGTVVIDDR
jgi:hypothetical protein